MAPEQLAPVSTLFLAFSMVSIVSLAPEFCEPVVRPAIRSWARFRHLLIVMKERFQRKCQSSYWEIDMTKFEP